MASWSCPTSYNRQRRLWSPGRRRSRRRRRRRARSANVNGRTAAAGGPSDDGWVRLRTQQGRREPGQRFGTARLHAANARRNVEARRHLRDRRDGQSSLQPRRSAARDHSDDFEGRTYRRRPLPASRSVGRSDGLTCPTRLRALIPVCMALSVLALSLGVAHERTEANQPAARPGVRVVPGGHRAGPGAARPWAAAPDTECDADCLFAAGYRDAGGPERYLRHLVEDVLPCEGAPDWSIIDYRNGYVSRAQFSPDSWRSAAAHTGVTAPDPYSVGRQVAWWINAIEREGLSPGSTAGWPTCWYAGGWR